MFSIHKAYIFSGLNNSGGLKKEMGDVSNTLGDSLI